MPKDTNLHIRIDSELKQRLEKQAKKENRSVANLVETVLLQYLDRQRQPELRK